MSIYYWIGAVLTVAMFATGVWLILWWARDRVSYDMTRRREDTR